MSASKQNGMNSRFSSALTKTAMLSRLLLTNPTEFGDRVATFVESQVERVRRGANACLLPRDEFVSATNKALRIDLAPFLSDNHVREVKGHIESRKRELEVDLHNPGLGPMCYALCRALRPDTVVETGVAFGATSAFILKALSVNGCGMLYSIDLPPLRHDTPDLTGLFVPETLRSRWKLIRGRARRVLPALVAELPMIDTFVHDSLHTYRNMLFEYNTVWPNLSPGGVLLSDDVALNRAFEDFASAKRPRFFALDRSALFGIMLPARTSAY
jgi:predicted O-methyltransferase YrrM